MKAVSIKKKTILSLIIMSLFFVTPLIALGLEFENADMQNDLNPSRRAVLADLNNNGYLDIYVAHRQPFFQNIIWINNGDGTFTNNSINAVNNTILGGVNIGDDRGVSYGVSIADLNNNGLLDIYVSNDDGQNRLWFNRGDVNGDGLIQFENKDITGDTNASWGNTIADFNGDGHLDIYVVNNGWGRANRLWLNNGDETFTNADIPGDDAGNPRHPKAVDINGNGFIDIVVPRYGQSNFIWYNDGNAEFTFDDSISPFVENSRESAIADFNRNGFLDIYIVNYSNQPNRLLINNGDGSFTHKDIPDDFGNTHGTFTVDFNNNGFPDIYVVNTNQQNWIWLNDGDANFEYYQIDGDEGTSVGAAGGDLNNNGLIDIYVANIGQNKLWLQVAPPTPPAPQTQTIRRSGVRLTPEQLAQLGVTIETQTPHTPSETTPEPTASSSSENPFGGELCPAHLIVTNNMKQGDRNGQFSSYNQGTVTQVALLQEHMNRLLLDEYGNQASGPVDGIFGPLTKRGVERLQNRLNQLLEGQIVPLVIDGIVGPFTRAAINMSC